jgi:hypothetical protein
MQSQLCNTKYPIIPLALDNGIFTERWVVFDEILEGGN